MSRELGREAENDAVSMLASEGYQILCRNYQTRFGEIDIIGWDHGVVVFIEVKKRASALYGGAISAITQTKIAKILITARIYLQQESLEDTDWRIDAVIIESNGKPKLIKNIYTEGLS